MSWVGGRGELGGWVWASARVCEGGADGGGGRGGRGQRGGQWAAAEAVGGGRWAMAARWAAAVVVVGGGRSCA